MASIAFKNVDGSTLSRVTILKDGRALEVNPPTKKTWPSMDAWVQEMPREWPRVEAWIAATASASAASATASASAASAASATAPASREKARRLYYTKQKQKTVVAGPQLAYFLKLPDGVTTTNREEVREALASYMERYMWLSCHVFWKVRDVKPAHPLYHLDDFLVTLTGLDPRGTFTARQILNALLARQTRAFAVAPATPGGDEEKPLDPEIVKLTAINTHLARYNLTLLVENSRLKAEIEALQARLCTIRAAACI